jgi:hypothetical protein
MKFSVEEFTYSFIQVFGCPCYRDKKLIRLFKKIASAASIMRKIFNQKWACQESLLTTPPQEQGRWGEKIRMYVI